MTQPLDLDAIEARATAATPGPWCTDSWEIYQGTKYEPGLSAWIGETCRGTSSLEQDRADAAFVAAARTDVPAMAAEIRQLRARVAELETRYLPKLCECGHTRFVHTVPAPNSCFAGQIRGAEPCDCAGYRQLSFAEAERRIAARHAAQAEQRAAAVETHVVADDSNDPEHTDDCPGCVAAPAARRP